MLAALSLLEVACRTGWTDPRPLADGCARPLRVAAFEGCVQAGDGFAHALKMLRRSAEREILQPHQRQPQREQCAHDDHAHEAHRAEGLALNVGDAEQEADPIVHAEEDAGQQHGKHVEPEPD